MVAERFQAGWTSRLECLVHHLGLALGGRPAAGFARRLTVPVSNATLLRVVRRWAKLPDGDSDEAAPLYRYDRAPGFRDDLAPGTGALLVLIVVSSSWADVKHFGPPFGVGCRR